MTLEQDVIAYLKEIPTPEYITDMDALDVKKHIRQAVDDISLYYPDYLPNAKVITKQVLYTVEAEFEGFGLLKRNGVTNYKVKDTDVTFSDSNTLSPIVIGIIEAETPPDETPLFGRLY